MALILGKQFTRLALTKTTVRARNKGLFRSIPLARRLPISTTAPASHSGKDAGNGSYDRNNRCRCLTGNARARPQNVRSGALSGKPSAGAGKEETAEKTRVFAAVQGNLTERGGFEPPVGFDPHAALAKRCYRPLSHLSGSCWTQHIYSRDADESKPDWTDSPTASFSANFCRFPP